MMRNVIVLVASLGVLGALFVGYLKLTESPAPGPGHSPPPRDSLPQNLERAADEAVRVGPVTIPGGGRIEFTRYDPNTGRPAERMLLDEWSPVPDSKNEIRVVRPEIVLLMPSGLIASVSAQRGQIAVDRVQRTDMKPKQGWLEGDARIVIQRPGADERAAAAPTTSSAAAAPRSAEPIEIRLGRIEFDLELGQLRSREALHLVSEGLELSGHGLQLEWNRAANRVETLLIERGDELRYEVQGGLFGALRDPDSAEVSASTPAATLPAAGAKSADVLDVRARPRGASAGVTYLCLLKDEVSADHFRGKQRVGGLSAAQLTLLFDLGGRADRMLGRQRSTSPPAADDEVEQLVVRWRGSLTLGPASQQTQTKTARRRLEASGAPVKLDLPNGSILCGRLVYQDESQQLWLYRGDAPVEFRMQRLTARAHTIYVDRGNNLVKLIGNVQLDSRAQTGSRGMRVRASEWAELKIDPARPTTLAADAGGTAPRAAPGPDATLTDYGQLRAATFVGGVQVALDDQTLACHRLETTFRAAQADEPLEALIESALASEDVRFSARGQSLSCAWMQLPFELGPDGRATPRQVDARGAVYLRDREQGAAARGARLTAALNPDGSVARATILGGARRAFAVVQPYAVAGQRIELDPEAQRVTVRGAPRLFSRTARSLQGEQRTRPEPLRVRCQDSIEIDGRANLVNFVGQVVARSGPEQLLGDSLSLELEDLPTPPRRAPSALENLQRVSLALLRGEDPRAAALAPSAPPSGQGGSVRKEPKRLVVRNGVLLTQSFDPADPQPIVQASIQGPELVVLVRERIVRSSGQTRLLLINRRLNEAADPQARETLGVPSALMTRGPSQTAMQCSRAMTYSLGPAGGATRSDNVLFEGDVLFVHRAGREMLNLEETLPQLRDNPELKAKLASRATLLQADRLEGRFESDGQAREAASMQPLRLSWLMAQGRVLLTDRQGEGIREVEAQQIEFDRPQSLVRVLGASGADARITYQNTQTQRFETPAIGPAFTIDLTKNTVRSGAVAGEIRR